jgi:hypothetical protein
MRWIEEGRMSDVITLLERMSENKKGKILKSFSTEDELDKLHEIHRLMIDSNKSGQTPESGQVSLDSTTEPANQPANQP